ncbi:MAG: glycosyltransferase family 2 protein [Verrucomicrobia bacterium]|nr:glycosyltransferase family 2 protein [Verrucomicrobiota bacterium]
MSDEHQTLTIVIPAYNEEKAIASIIERCLAERERIMAETPVSEVEIVVVNDGSRDRTAEIARRYEVVRLISYDKNQGYGAALKRGFDEAHGTLVSFLDADGTCDPAYFIPLVNELVKQKADVALGSRLGPESEMPRIRRLGNRIYTMLINALTSAKITDSASGMRVIRKASLQRLYPLPDGLHFTPAMTARAVSVDSLKLIEVPISYKERVGKSKLSVIRDGLRFLEVIVDIILSYRPLRFFFYVAAFALGVAAILFIRPLQYYVMYRNVPDWMVYRLIAVVVLVLASLTMMTVGLVADQIAELVNAEVRRRRARAIERFVRAVLSHRALIVAGPVLVVIGLAVNWRTFHQLLVEGHVKVPWVFPVTGAFFVLMGVWSWALGMLQRIVRTLRLRELDRTAYRDPPGGTGGA